MMEVNIHRAEIAAYNRAFAALAEDFCPLVIHLKTEVASLFPAICKERGEDWLEGVMSEVNGFPYQTDRGRRGLIAFFEEGQELVSELAVQWRHIEVDTTERQWDEYRRQIMAVIVQPGQ